MRSKWPTRLDYWLIRISIGSAILGTVLVVIAIVGAILSGH